MSPFLLELAAGGRVVGPRDAVRCGPALLQMKHGLQFAAQRECELKVQVAVLVPTVKFNKSAAGTLPPGRVSSMPKVVFRILPANLALIVPLLEKSVVTVPVHKKRSQAGHGQHQLEIPAGGLHIDREAENHPAVAGGKQSLQRSGRLACSERNRDAEALPRGLQLLANQAHELFCDLVFDVGRLARQFAGVSAASQQTIHDWKQQHGINLQQCDIAVVSDLQRNQISS